MSETCPKCGQHPGRDHLKMKVALAIAAGENARLQAIVDKLAAFDGVVPVGVYGRVKLCEQLLALATEAEKENSDVGTTM